jgi:BioD-like phosphotransacetylase family protein
MHTKRGQGLQKGLLRHYFMIYKVCGVLLRDAPNGADFLVVEQNTIELVSSLQHLRPEGRSDELPCRRQFMYHC